MGANVVIGTGIWLVLVYWALSADSDGWTKASWVVIATLVCLYGMLKEWD